MISLGEKFPEFKKAAVVSTEKGKEFADISSNDHKENDQWLVMFWYPKDFTFVCPTELAEFNKNYSDFRDRDTQLIGASTDSEFVHLAWREDLGILESEEKIAYRVTIIADPDGVIRWISANDLSVGRNVKEVIRVLDALQTDELCPCNWEKGQDTIKV